MGLKKVFNKAPGLQVNTDYFKGKNTAIDGYNILFRLRSRCADACARNDIKTVAKCFAQIIGPIVKFSKLTIIVWDGFGLPCKAPTSVPRYEKQLFAQAQLKLGHINQQNLQDSFYLDKGQVQQLSDVLKLMFNRLDYCFSPFEADYQLAFMYKYGFVDCVVSNDGDLVFHGVPTVRFWDNGAGELFTDEHIGANRTTQLINGVLGGCDYFPYQCGLTYNEATERFAYDGDPGGYQDINQIVQSFVSSFLVFKYEWVYNPESKKLHNLNSVPLDDQPLVKLLPINALGYESPNVYQLCEHQAQIKSRPRGKMGNESVVKMLRLKVDGTKVTLPGLQAVDISGEYLCEAFLAVKGDDIKSKWAFVSRYQLSSETE